MSTSGWAGAWWWEGEAEKGLIVCITSTGYPSLLREGDNINEFQKLYSGKDVEHRRLQHSWHTVLHRYINLWRKLRRFGVPPQYSVQVLFPFQCCPSVPVPRRNDNGTCPCRLSRRPQHQGISALLTPSTAEAIPAVTHTTLGRHSLFLSLRCSRTMRETQGETKRHTQIYLNVDWEVWTNNTVTYPAGKRAYLTGIIIIS